MLDDFASQIKENVSLKELTTAAIGGPAKQFISVTSPADLLKLLQLAHEQDIPYFLMGGGSNLLISDGGINKLVIHNKVSGIKQEGDTVVVESGTALQDLVDFTVDHGLAGMQKMTGIPGTVGGAVYGNAGAYGQTISDYLVSVDCFNGNKVITLTKEKSCFGYRDSVFKANHFTILQIRFQLPSALKGQALQKEAVEIATKRALNYPNSLCCPGSFFKNIVAKSLPPQILQTIPPEKITFGKIPAGYLLEEVGAKGQSLGNIQISQTHANLFMNLGDGTAKDFWQLARIYAEKVKERFGIDLEPEVQLINLPPLSS